MALEAQRNPAKREQEGQDVQGEVTKLRENP
jgi:hypothetical protein